MHQRRVSANRARTAAAHDGTRIRLVVADDEPIVLSGLDFLFSTTPGFDVVGRCTNGHDAVRLARRVSPDVLLVDNDINGLSAAGILRQVATETRVIVYAADMPDVGLTEAIELGARGVALKKTDLRLLVQCIRDVHAGRRWLDPYAAGNAFERRIDREAASREISAVLTRRELEVARGVERGLSNKALASQLHVSEGTVKNHLHAIYEKLQLRGRLALVLYLKARAAA